jgi:hypothetical protein
LGLERGELGKRRVRVRQLVLTPLVARALDVFCPQFGIAVRTVAAVAAIRAVPPRGAKAAIGTGRTIVFGTARRRFRPAGTRRAVPVLPLAIGSAFAMLTRPAMLPCRPVFPGRRNRPGRRGNVSTRGRNSTDLRIGTDSRSGADL